MKPGDGRERQTGGVIDEPTGSDTERPRAGAGLPAAGAILSGCRANPRSGAGGDVGAPAGEFKTRFLFPKAVAIDRDGAVCVACAGGFGGLLKARRKPDGGGFETVWEAEGGKEKWSVRGVAVGPGGDVFATVVVGKDFQGVRRWSSDGTAAGSWAPAGPGDTSFCGPAGIAVDGAGCVYVVEAEWWGLEGGHRVQKFGPGGALLAAWGSKGSGEGQLNLPTGAALDREGNLVVADTYNSRLLTFAPDGALLGARGVRGVGDGQFDRPQGAAFDAAGALYVADTFNNHVQKFAPDGRWLAAWGRRGSGPGEFWLPCGIAVDAAGDVYVADTMNNRVQVFRPSAEEA